MDWGEVVGGHSNDNVRIGKFDLVMYICMALNWLDRMNIHAEKLGLIEWIIQLNDTMTLEKLKRIMSENNTGTDWWDEISAADKESIERGLKDVEEGRVYPHETVKKLYERYL